MNFKVTNRWLVLYGAILLQICMGANYGIVYQVYGIAALGGPVIVAALGGLKPTFMVAAVLAIIGGAMTFMVKTLSLENVVKKTA